MPPYAISCLSPLPSIDDYAFIFAAAIADISLKPRCRHAPTLRYVAGVMLRRFTRSAAKAAVTR
jgi:hypothetical protein